MLAIIDIPYALVISVIVGVTNMIPYFGPFIGAIPGILLLIIADFGYAVIFTILIIALQQFDGLYLGPKILGESTGLRPIWIIFAITVGGWVLRSSCGGRYCTSYQQISFRETGEEEASV